MKKTVIEKLSDIAKLIKDKFEDSEEATQATTEETTEEVTAEFAEVTLADGSILSYEGELTEGTAVFVVDEGEQIPAVEGTYALGGELEGVSLVIDAEGKILEVIDEREEGGTTEEAATEEQAEAMSSEEVEGMVDEKMSAFTEALTTIAKGVESLLSENDSLKSDLAEFKTEFAEFKELPSDKKEEKKKFSRNEVNKSPAEMRTARMTKERNAKK